MQIEHVRVLNHAIPDFARRYGEQQQRKAAAMNVVEGCKKTMEKKSRTYSPTTESAKLSCASRIAIQPNPALN